MIGGELTPEPTCKDSLQVRTDAGGPWPVPARHGRSVVKESFTTESGAAGRCAATIKNNLIVAQSPLPAGRVMDATDLRELEALEKQIKRQDDQS